MILGLRQRKIEGEFGPPLGARKEISKYWVSVRSTGHLHGSGGQIHASYSVKYWSQLIE